MENDNKIIILIDDRWLKSLIRDAGSFITLTTMVGVGVWLESSAMQWIGGILWILMVMTKAGQTHKYTISEARSELDRLEADNE